MTPLLLAALSVVQAQESLARTEDQSAELTAVREALVDKETTIDQLKEQVETLLREVTSLNEAYTRLQVIYLVISIQGAPIKNSPLEKML